VSESRSSSRVWRPAHRLHHGVALGDDKGQFSQTGDTARGHADRLAALELVEGVVPLDPASAVFEAMRPAVETRGSTARQM
jgi:hypothetical protein